MRGLLPSSRRHASGSLRAPVPVPTLLRPEYPGGCLTQGSPIEVRRHADYILKYRVEQENEDTLISL